MQRAQINRNHKCFETNFIAALKMGFILEIIELERAIVSIFNIKYPESKTPVECKRMERDRALRTHAPPLIVQVKSN